MLGKIAEGVRKHEAKTLTDPAEYGLEYSTYGTRLVYLSKDAVKKLFDELVEQFVNRNGGYTRIYKLALPRLGDAAEMALIEFVEEAPKKKAKKKKAVARKAKPTTEKLQESGDTTEEKSQPEEIEAKKSASKSAGKSPKADTKKAPKKSSTESKGMDSPEEKEEEK